MRNPSVKNNLKFSYVFNDKIMLQVKPVECTSKLKCVYTINPKRKLQAKPVHNLASSGTVNHKSKSQVKPVPIKESLPVL